MSSEQGLPTEQDINEPAASPERAGLPFLIRGHHLPIYARSLYWILSRLAEKGAKAIKQHAPDDEFGSWYAQDVLGPSLDERPFIDHMTEQLQTFRELSPESPIHIIVAQADEICKGCAVGEHCKLRYPKGIKKEVNDTIGDDGQWLEGFLFVLRLEGIELPLVQDTVNFPDSPDPAIVRRVITNAGTVRRVINDFRFSPR